MADVFVENILYLGDTRSADDLSVFTKMAPERLCLGCGLRVDEPFAPIATGERKKLFYAAQKLLTFVLHEVSAQTLSEEEAALQAALRPLITNKDGHFVAAVTSMYQSLLEGKTDCPISGVFGAFFLARCCLGQVPGGAPFSQRSEQATACTNRMQIRN